MFNTQQTSRGQAGVFAIIVLIVILILMFTLSMFVSTEYTINPMPVYIFLAILGALMIIEWIDHLCYTDATTKDYFFEPFILVIVETLALGVIILGLPDLFKQSPAYSWLAVYGLMGIAHLTVKESIFPLKRLVMVCSPSHSGISKTPPMTQYLLYPFIIFNNTCDICVYEITDIDSWTIFIPSETEFIEFIQTVLDGEPSSIDCCHSCSVEDSQGFRFDSGFHKGYAQYTLRLFDDSQHEFVDLCENCASEKIRQNLDQAPIDAGKIVSLTV